jgi:enoyl-CoA hydratase
MDRSDEATPVTLERVAAHVALVTIRRPGARNAVNGAVAQALDRIVKQTEADPDVWAVVLTGEGGVSFCAGADLKEVSAGRLPTLMTRDGGFAGFVHARRDKFWIAAVEGVAVAGGCEIALACDAIVAAEDGLFALPEVKRGLIASAGGLYRLPRLLPRNVAFELIVTGDTLQARRAYELGMVNRLAPKGGVIDAAVALAEAACRNAPIAVRESLKVARQAPDLDDRALRAASEAGQDAVMVTEDFREGPLAFIEKREPRWQGR